MHTHTHTHTHLALRLWKLTTLSLAGALARPCGALVASQVQKSAIEAEKDLMDVAANASKQPAEFDLKEHVKNTVNFQFQFGKLLKELGNYGDSYKMLLRCEELAGDVWKDKDEHQNLASLHTEVGLAAKQLGDVDTAERYYKKAFQLYEDDGEVITKEVAVLQLKFGPLTPS